MACKTESKQIGDHEISVTQWPATKSILMKFKLIKAFGAAITSIAGNSEKGEPDAGALAEGLSELFNSTSPEELSNMLKECVIGVAYDGTKITETSFNTLFSGDELPLVYQIFMFVIRVNYASLMTGQSVKRLLAKANLNL